MKKENAHKIVIVGGGAGGMILATKLGRKFKNNSDIRVTLIDQSLTHLWKPLLHEVASGTLDSNEDEINFLVHAYHNHFEFVFGKMVELDRRNKSITLDEVKEGKECLMPARKISFDTLVIAIGSVTSDFNIPGVQKYCYVLDSRQQADEFHRQFIAFCHQLKYKKSQDNDNKLEVVIVGGGATGVELAAELNTAIEQFSYVEGVNFKPNFKITLIESASRLLPSLPEKLALNVTNILKKLGVEVLTDESVKLVKSEAIYTNKERTIPAQIKVWAAGVRAPQLLKNFDDLESNRIDQLLVTSTLQTTKDKNIFVLGDCAACPIQNGQAIVPPQAQAAQQEAKYLVKAIQNHLKNKPLRPFVYYNYGSLVSLSQFSAVGNLMGNLLGSYFLQGKLAQWAYRALYKRHQIILFGWWKTVLLTIANTLARRVKTRLKFH